VLRRIRLIVSDLDQTVFDCADLRTRALLQALDGIPASAARDVRIPDEIEVESAYRDHGYRWVGGLESGAETGQSPALERACRVQQVRLLEGGHGGLFPGIAGFFDSCRRAGAAWAICADSHRDYLMTVCDRFELSECVEHLSCAEEYGSGGTDEMLEETLERCEALASETVYLGTRPDSLEAARYLGIAPVACCWGLRGGFDFGAETITVRRVSDLGECLARLDAHLSAEDS
jgi:phosphoglycolate phosphatase-like HAD superfamily hydrolase